MRQPAIEARPGLPYVSIPAEANLQEWGPVTALVGEVMGCVHERGLELTAPPFFRYWVIGDTEKRFQLEIGVPIDREVDGDDRVRPGRIPAGSYATAVHEGHPDRLEGTSSRLEDWIGRQGLEVALRSQGGEEVWEGRFEFYPTDPRVEPDASRWEVEVAYLLASGSQEDPR
ncbi:MAG: GyrI-like domain-containing protein [Actinomycetota bacterium]